MNVGKSLRGSAGLPTYLSISSRRHLSGWSSRCRVADRSLQKDVRCCQPFIPSQSTRRHSEHHSNDKCRRLSTCACTSSGAASLPPPSEAYKGSNQTHANREALLRTFNGALWIFLALGWVCACVAAGRGTTAFASLALSSSKLSQEGLRAAVRSAWAGLGAGFLHTLSGPDHLAALTPLTIGRSSFNATLLGALWGFGHSIGQLILGLLMVVLKDRFTSFVPALSKYGSLTVGCTLLVIGVVGLYENLTEGEQIAEVASEPQPALAGASAAGVSSEAQALNSGGGGGAANGKRGGSGLHTLFTGIVFGLQPDALFVIVPALALPTKLAAMAYIFMFVFGTVAAMGSYTAFIGATSHAMQKNYSGLCSKLSSIASLVAIGIGSAVLAAGWGVRLPFL